MDFKEAIIKELKKHVKLKEIPLEVPPDQAMGDFSFPCFVLAKEWKKSPNDIAEELEGMLKIPDGIREIEAKGPYLNFFVKKDELSKDVLKEVLTKKEKFGEGKKNHKHYLLEFFHGNTHKGVHIGHIRNMCLGSALANVMETAGYDIKRINYQGDIGPHVVKCLWGLKHTKKRPPSKDRMLWLGEIYIAANKKIKDSKKLQAEIKEMTTKLYAGDKELNKKWKETRKWCLDEYEDFYKDFGVKFDKFYFESEVEKPGIQLAHDLVKKKIAKEDEGALIIDFKDDVLGVFVLVTKEGYALYSAKDLGLAMQKLKDFKKIDKSVHVVGKEQELHFKQLFKTFELMKIDKKIPSHHMIYELVMLPEGKMSSRDGNVVLYPELRDKLYEAAKEEVTKRHKDWSAKRIDESATNIAFAGLKFGMVARENQRVMVFDWEKALDFEGDTGPYIQYAHARICSILRKWGKPVKKDIDYSLLEEEEEVALIKLMEDYPNVVAKAADDMRVHTLAHHLLAMARKLNEFYHVRQIIKEDEGFRDARLVLITAVKQVLENGLGLLGINAPEEM